MPYDNFQHYLEVLEREGCLKWIETEVDKDWEITSVARNYFRRVPGTHRRALGFRKVKGYDIPVVLGAIGASRKIYGLALEAEPGFASLKEAWSKALANPIPPVVVDGGPCKEVILKGAEVDLGRFPVPTWTPEKDPAPFLTAPCLITKHAETGIGNIGTYRMEIKARNETGILWDLPSQHGAVHYRSWEQRNEPMPMAVVIGADPTIIMTSVSKVPLDVDEMTVAGGLRGQPVAVVKCETCDLFVPATAEIVLEGEVLPGERVEEGPFGEYTGYMGGPYLMPKFHVKCITHRKKPVYHALFSQMPPSESSLMRQLPEEANVYQHLAGYLKIPGIVDVHLPEAGGSYTWCWISLKKAFPGHAQQVLSAAWTHYPSFAKWIVVTDDDVDIRDPFMREWVLSFRVEPKKDIFFLPNTAPILLDPSSDPPEVPLWERRSSKILIDATKKWEYPPIALPPEKYLERAARQWDKYGLD
ncbi:MAG: UbiD family decarboxylase [Thermodesulfobacteriota bacterium]